MARPYALYCTTALNDGVLDPYQADSIDAPCFRIVPFGVEAPHATATNALERWKPCAIAHFIDMFIVHKERDRQIPIEVAHILQHSWIVERI